MEEHRAAAKYIIIFEGFTQKAGRMVRLILICLVLLLLMFQLALRVPVLRQWLCSIERMSGYDVDLRSLEEWKRGI